ncbi:hypothetical protein SDC9_159057 [bioreactor metagenome]|uniref:Uncharacterized protein n=1 Tax=bioreactor metagenome TaxID=1076179 RepID=A0A645FEH9_9ZZZZ
METPVHEGLAHGQGGRLLRHTKGDVMVEGLRYAPEDQANAHARAKEHGEP